MDPNVLVKWHLNCLQHRASFPSEAVLSVNPIRSLSSLWNSSYCQESQCVFTEGRLSALFLSGGAMANKSFCYLRLLITPQLSFYEAVETQPYKIASTGPDFTYTNSRFPRFNILTDPNSPQLLSQVPYFWSFDNGGAPPCRSVSGAPQPP